MGSCLDIFNAMAHNNKQWSSATPGLLIFLIDQSGSMTLPYDGNDTRTVFASRVINRVINDIIQRNFNGTEPKNRCFISVIGYGGDVKTICSGYLKDLYLHPKRVDVIKKKISDGAGGLVETDYKMPIWVDPIDEDTCTDMKGAFEAAKKMAEEWIKDKPNNPAPVIINISDGMPYYESKNGQLCMKETEDVANEIMALSNDDGNVLIFNVEIGNGSIKILTPSDEEEMNVAGEPAKFLYRISSEIPDGYKDAAEKNELPLKQGSKGCIFNADAEYLIKFIDFGSSKGRKDPRQ